MKKQKYFDGYERTDYEKLVSFNNERKFFNELGQTPSGHVYDASGLTNDGRLVAIELKSRNAVLTKEKTLSGRNFNDSTVYIEDEKVAGLAMANFVTGAIPLYINFLLDGTTLIWNLTKLKRMPKRIPTVIRNMGYQSVEKCYREGLYIEDSKIYRN